MSRSSVTRLNSAFKRRISSLWPARSKRCVAGICCRRIHLYRPCSKICLTASVECFWVALCVHMDSYLNEICPISPKSGQNNGGAKYSLTNFKFIIAIISKNLQDWLEQQNHLTKPQLRYFAQRHYFMPMGNSVELITISHV
jgi:hypothetical protein